MANTEKTQNPARQIPSPVSKETAPHPNVRVLEGLLHKTKKQRGKKKSLIHSRHLILGAAFAIMVVVPTSAASFYMTFVAADQYESATSSTVRSIDNMPATGDLLGIFSQSGATSTVSDSYIVSDYILSDQMVRKIDEKFDLSSTYAIRGGDFYYGLKPDSSIEDKTAFWQSVASVTYDHSSNILKLTIRAFEPAQAKAIASFVLASCESLINQLSDSAREESLKSARTELSIAEKRIVDARTAIRDFREQSQDIDPVEAARQATQLVGAMEERLSKLTSDLTTAQSQMAEDTPRVRVIKAQIESLEKQISEERLKLGGGSSASQSGTRARNSDTPLHEQAVADKLQLYEALETEREFSQQAYTAAMASLEKARIEARSKQRYIAAFIEPTSSEEAQYPRRFLNILLVFLGSIFTWSVMTLGYYNLRDRA